jgi:hypothetical protein
VRSDCRSSLVGTVHRMSRANDLTDMQEELLDSGKRGTPARTGPAARGRAHQ